MSPIDILKRRLYDLCGNELDQYNNGRWRGKIICEKEEIDELKKKLNNKINLVFDLEREEQQLKRAIEALETLEKA